MCFSLCSIVILSSSAPSWLDFAVPFFLKVGVRTKFDLHNNESEAWTEFNSGLNIMNQKVEFSWESCNSEKNPIVQ
ncbi:uncharacterized protein G2W53_018600 [Senna tora]|uniref:Uncharacterized protein n=1 Tax=Senna tora TaxID=362788 RepID=A0A834WQ02_9FABA|nr:uncharacterized protein G2W53_018600 [Senna tora]